MRILMVNSHGTDTIAGGAELAVQLLSQGIAARGHGVSLVAAYPSESPDEETPTTVLRSLDWRRSRIARARSHAEDWLSRPSAGLSRVVTSSRPDVVHTFNLQGLGSGIWEVCHRLDVPVVHTIHDYHLLCPRVTMMRPDGVTPCSPHPLLCGLRTRRLGRHSGSVKALIGVSDYVLGAHASLFPRATRRVVRAPVAIPHWRAMRPPSATLRTLGFIGKLEAIKGVRALLDAVPALVALGVEIRIAGGGRLESEVASAAASQPLLHFHGVVSGEKKADFYEACDLGIIPSVWPEPGGPQYTMIEWLSSGRPVLVSRRGGLGEVVDAFGGSIAIEPTAEGIVGEIRRLTAATRWRDTVDRVAPVVEDELDRWVEMHEGIYESVLRR